MAALHRRLCSWRELAHALGSPVALALVVAVAGCLIYMLDLGSTGVVDETPAIFAASSRTMAEGGGTG